MNKTTSLQNYHEFTNNSSKTLKPKSLATHSVKQHIDKKESKKECKE